MIESSVSFFMPQGQALGYLRGDPLTEGDLAELRLGHRLVFVALADPMVYVGDHVEPKGTDLATLKWIEHEARNAAQTAVRAEQLPTVEEGQSELLARHDTHVEAVVLESDPEGRLTDRVIYCLATLTSDGQAVLQRCVAVGYLPSSPYRDELHKLVAVVAWGDWWADDTVVGDDCDPHEPRHGHPIPAGAVRVLSVARRHDPEGERGTPTGRHVAPHLRRGHWRRQHYGPRSELVRRMWISPVLVNADRGVLAPMVYRLPTIA